MTKATTKNVIEVQGLKNYLGGHYVHNGLDFSIKEGEIIAIIGGSGCGKTTLLRSLLMLLKPKAGVIKIFGTDVTNCSTAEALSVQQRWGVMFQNSALFSSLTLLENIIFPLKEHSSLNTAEQKDIATLKMVLSGLEIDAANKYPAELSGGMQKRAALARAIALDPELIFLDEPTSGLDPSSAEALDQLILQLRENLGLTFVMITHDLDSLWTVPDKVMFLGEGKILAFMPMKQLVEQTHPLIKEYFSGTRGKRERNDRQEK